MDIVSTRMLGQFGFLATVFGIFKDNQISVDVVATSEISISLTLDPRHVPQQPNAFSATLTCDHGKCLNKKQQNHTSANRQVGALSEASQLCIRCE